jgi:hypothetical protein
VDSQPGRGTAISVELPVTDLARKETVDGHVHTHLAG